MNLFKKVLSSIVFTSIVAVALTAPNVSAAEADGTTAAKGIPVYPTKKITFSVDKGSDLNNLVGVLVERYQPSSTANSMTDSDYTSKVEIDGKSEWFIGTDQATLTGNEFNYQIKFDTPAVEKTLFSPEYKASTLGITSHNLLTNNVFFKVNVTPLYRSGSGVDAEGEKVSLYILLDKPPVLVGSAVPNQVISDLNRTLKFASDATTIKDEPVVPNDFDDVSPYYRIMSPEGSVLKDETKFGTTVKSNGQPQKLPADWLSINLPDNILNLMLTNPGYTYEFYTRDSKGAKSNILTATFSVDVTKPTIKVPGYQDKMVVSESTAFDFGITATDTGSVKVNSGINITYSLYKNTVTAGNKLTGPNFSGLGVDTMTPAEIFFDPENPEFVNNGIYIFEIHASDGRNSDAIKQIKVKVDNTGTTKPNAIP